MVEHRVRASRADRLLAHKVNMSIGRLVISVGQNRAGEARGRTVRPSRREESKCIISDLRRGPHYVERHALPGRTPGTRRGGHQRGGWCSAGRRADPVDGAVLLFVATRRAARRSRPYVGTAS